MSERGAAGGTAGEPPLLEVEDLRIRFRTGLERVNAVNGVDFTVNRGETAAILEEANELFTAGDFSKAKKALDKKRKHTIDIVVDRLVVPEKADTGFATRLAESLDDTHALVSHGHSDRHFGDIVADVNVGTADCRQRGADQGLTGAGIGQIDFGQGDLPGVLFDAAIDLRHGRIFYCGQRRDNDHV